MRNNFLLSALFCLLFGLTTWAQQPETETEDETQKTNETETETEKKHFLPSERIKADDQIYFPVDI